MFSRLMKSILTMARQKPQQQTSHVSEPQAPGPLSLNRVLDEFQGCSDLSHRTYPVIQADILFFDHLVDKQKFINNVIIPLENIRREELGGLLHQSQFKLEDETTKVVRGILDGDAALFVPQGVYLISVYGPEKRAIESSQTESTIVGPHDSFNESLDTNLSIIRRRVKSSRLKAKQFEVGEIFKTKVSLLYLDEIANMDFVNRMSERIQSIEYSGVFDGSMLLQLIEDFPSTIFPLFLTSERPDVAVSKLNEGRVVVIMDQSPSVIVGPTTVFEFFSSPDDYYSRWAVGTSLRLLRYIAFVLTLTLTSMYVSITTYHYEMIPINLLASMSESRSRVPFPPVLEALLMETTLELLREAGARLPSKIGQTIGIVGGIVIGTAAVDAGFTSNILIIAVAMSAIASFVIPSYTMSGSIRLIRFALIILSGMLGNFGFIFGLGLVIIHLSKLTSLGAPYTLPLAPIKPSDWKDTFIRGPFWMFSKRPKQSRSPNETTNKMKK
ncbi:spore germination protein [Paenibacillus sp. J53TS2]|uniref:spore germination protein n=1 Tax=Paenibacillus sp. J53TS2 TaxID=2807197 RepID=UPI001B02E5DE|nr:spore germination protein [Paenibacillus sp. J53TS2]GIP49745.1 spore germination protein [Paenibacillus sp. J53TS2]